MNILINLVKRPAIAILAPLFQAFNSGHIRSSLTRRAVTKNGSPVPWYTQPAVRFLLTRDFSKSTVLEFGGGQSTIWWSHTAKKVITFEDDPEWLEKCRVDAGINSQWHLIERGLKGEALENYIKSLIVTEEGGNAEKFDIVIVDSMHRETLVKLAKDLVTESGLVIVDNSEGYNIHQLTKDWNNHRVDFIGPANGVFSAHVTSFFFEPNCQYFSPARAIKCD